jgi:hypothetical protein
MFRALSAHPSEAPHKRHLIYFVRMSVGCGTVAVHRTQYTKCRCVAPPEDEQVMLETCRGPLILNKLDEKWITLVLLY